MLALIVMIMRCQAKNLFGRFDKVSVRDQLPRIRSTFCQVFRENSSPLRRKFFKEPLIKILWPKYIEHQGDAINQYWKSLHPKQRQTLEIDAQDISSDISFPVPVT